MIEKHYQGYIFNGNDNNQYTAIINITPKLNWIIGIYNRTDKNSFTYSDLGPKAYPEILDIVASFSIKGSEVFELLTARHDIKYYLAELRNFSRPRIDDSKSLDLIISDESNIRMVSEYDIKGIQHAIEEFCLQCDNIIGNSIKEYLLE